MLACVVVVVPLVAMHARTTTSSRLLANALRADREADVLIGSATGAIEDWLTKHADSVVLPPGTTAPSLQVCSLSGALSNDTPFSLSITAIDQHALPRPAELRDEKLAQALGFGDNDLRLAIIETLEDTKDAPGWDTVARALATASRDKPDEQARQPGDDFKGAAYRSGTAGSEPPLLARLALHAEPIDRSTTRATAGSWRINLSTASDAVIEACEQRLGVRFAPLVRSARSEGEPPPVGEIRFEQPSTGRTGDTLLTARSDAWLFLVTARVANIERSRVIVYHRDRDRWEPVHSHVVRHP